MIALSRGVKPATNTRTVIKSIRKEPRTFCRPARQRHTKTSRTHETLRNSAGTQLCGHERRRFARGDTTLPPPAFFPLPQLPPRPLSAVSIAPSTPGVWTLPWATALSAPAPPAYHHQCSLSFPVELPWRVCLCWQQRRQPYFVLVHPFVSLCFCLLELVSIVTVDNVGQTVRILVVMMRQRKELVLTPIGRRGETKVLALHGLHVGPDRCDDRHNLAKLQLEEDRNLSSPTIQIHSTFLPVPPHADVHSTCNVKVQMAAVYGRDVQRLSTEVRELDHPARSPDRPGQPDPRSTRDLQQWIVN